MKMDDFCFFGMHFTSDGDGQKTLRLVDGKILRVMLYKQPPVCSASPEKPASWTSQYSATAKFYTPEAYERADEVDAASPPNLFSGNSTHEVLKAALESVAFRPRLGRFDYNCVLPLHGDLIYADIKSANELKDFFWAQKRAGVNFDEMHTLAIFNYRAAMPGGKESHPMLRLAMNEGLHSRFCWDRLRDNHQMVVRVGGRHHVFLEVYFFSDHSMTVGTDWSNIRVSENGW